MDLIGKRRNIYALADLYHQNRKDVSEIINDLASVETTDGDLVIKDDQALCQSSGKTYTINDNIVDFTGALKDQTSSEWARLNEQFLNYHKSLSPYTMINDTPILNYVSLKSGIGELKNAKVIDVGAGTGHGFCSFFHFPETLDYYLVDPNLRLLHDQFIRLYPKLTRYKIGHVLSFAEKLPFKSGIADVVMSLSSIDHFNDFPEFIKEAHRLLKPGGKLLIYSHLDIPHAPDQIINKERKYFLSSFFEKLARYLYYRTARVGQDDHTYHFETPDPINKSIEATGFTIDKSEVFKNFFFIVANK